MCWFLTYMDTLWESSSDTRWLTRHGHFRTAENAHKKDRGQPKRRELITYPRVCVCVLVVKGCWLERRHRQWNVFTIFSQKCDVFYWTFHSTHFVVLSVHHVVQCTHKCLTNVIMSCMIYYNKLFICNSLVSEYQVHLIWKHSGSLYDV